MKFGTTFSSHWDGDVPQSAIYRQTLERIQLSERLGYWSAWVTEHHFASDPEYKPYGWEGPLRAYDLTVDPLTLLTYAAAMTSTIRLGTGVLVLHYDNPVRVAERAAMLDVLSGGRLELGLGRGGGFREPLVFDVPTDKNVSKAKFIEGIDILLKSWAGGSFSFEGEHFKLPNMEVVPTPLQRPNIPLYLGVGDTPSLEYAARNGLSYAGIVCAWGWDAVDAHRAAHKAFADAAAAANRDISEALYPNTLFLFCAESDAEAEERAEEHLMRFSLHAEAHYENRRPTRSGSGQSVPLLAGGGTPAPLGMSDLRAKVMKQFETNLIGSPRTIAEKLSAVRERVPTLNYVLAVSDAGSPPDDFVKNSMTLFAEQVVPRFSQQGFSVAAE